jgi:RHS repeat-associated protein
MNRQAQISAVAQNTHDAVGNLTTRGDTLHAVSESFAYDALNRLTSYTVTGQGTALSRTMRYNSAGSITEKSDVCAVNNCFAYAGPQSHALSSVAGTVGGVTNPNFLYDANGNLVCMTAESSCDANAAKTVAWTSFNTVAQVQQGATTVSLLYDPDHARVAQTAPEGTTLYLTDPASGAMTEHFAPTTGAITWRNYITVDGKIVAERSTTGSSAKVRYFVLDHLGSTVALTDETGTLVESDAYDAWGKARNATTGADDTTCSLPSQSFSTRGYTGHEEMPDLCLVNMNARIYDPVIGRFMSPDDMITDAYNGQNYNRYTYVDDNPLSYTDPTGHMTCTTCTGLSDASNPFSTINDPNGYCIGCDGSLNGDIQDDIRDDIQQAKSLGLVASTASPSAIRTDMGKGIITLSFAVGAEDHTLSADSLAHAAQMITASQESGGRKFTLIGASNRLMYDGGEISLQGQGGAWTLSQYYKYLGDKGIDGQNLSIPADTMKIIMDVTNSSEFKSMAQPVYDAAKISGKETDGIDVFNNANTPDALNINLVPYHGVPMTCPNGILACMGVPYPDPKNGSLIFEWHPHAVQGPYNWLPSTLDEERSAQLNHAPGVIWSNQGSTYRQSTYQGNCVGGVSQCPQ